jgi:hypothetical protein
MSETAIMNMALDLLEEQPILAGDDDTATVRWMNRNFGPIRDALLRQHPWNWALARASLPASLDAPAFQWARQFELPPGCLRVLPIFDQYGRPWQFEIEGRRILTDAGAPLQIRYVERVTDTNQWDPMFVQVMAAALAYRMASWLTGKLGYRDRIKQELRELLIQAQMVDALESGSDEPMDDDWILGRTTGVTY